MAVDPRLAAVAEPRVMRFGVTERRLHMAHATAFGVLILTGLVLYLPMLAQILSDRPLMKSIHLAAAAAWLTALVLVAVLGDGAQLRATRREIERFDADDLLFLRRRAAPSGRFNGGQKAHAIVQAGLAVLFTVSGVLLWLGERDTAFRLPGTIALHDAATLLVAVLVAGHIAMAFSRPQSLEGILRGTVPESYAAEHHAKWRPARAVGEAAAGWRPGPMRISLALLVAAAGLVAIVALLRDIAG
ncbi:MAG: formate dehydrogenase subunit gamma [Solirubrobacteraceae bacterium]|jgi:formate dehydrogenase subunit gamma|nr:formate dehydrogenase subunit gamma [Solirubrobacteraceae bacterium]